MASTAGAIRDGARGEVFTIVSSKRVVRSRTLHRRLPGAPALETTAQAAYIGEALREQEGRAAATAEPVVAIDHDRPVAGGLLDEGFDVVVVHVHRTRDVRGLEAGRVAHVHEQRVAGFEAAASLVGVDLADLVH